MSEVMQIRSDDIEVRAVMSYSAEQVEGFVMEMIVSAPAESFSVEDVITNLQTMKVADAEQYREVIKRMIDADIGGSDE